MRNLFTYYRLLHRTQSLPASVFPVPNDINKLLQQGCFIFIKTQRQATERLPAADLQGNVNNYTPSK
jgi:hypothetical protein